jgi:hypothetical protein
MPDIGKGIQSLRDFKRKTSAFPDQMRDSGHPLVLTINGNAELVVQDASFLDRMEELDSQTLQPEESLR